MNDSQTFSPEEIDQMLTVMQEQQTEIEIKDEKIYQLEQQITTLEQQNSRLLNLNESKMNSELLTKLQEKDKQLLTEQEQNRQLRKSQDEADRACETYKKEIKRLETVIENINFDKDQYLKEFEEKEKSVREQSKENRRTKAFLDEHIQNRAYEIEQETISRCEAEKERYKRQCEADKQAKIDEYNQLLHDESEKIQSEADRQAEQRKSELETEYSEKSKQLEAEYSEKNQKLDNQIEENNKKQQLMTAKSQIIGGNVVYFGLVCGIVSVWSAATAFFRGLLPSIREDGAELLSWIVSNWNTMIGEPFGAANIFAGLIFGAILTYLVSVTIWTIKDIDERKWVFFADKLSLTILTVSVSISAFGGEWIAAYLNPLLIPIIVYTIYFWIKSGWGAAILVPIKDKLGEKIEDTYYKIRNLTQNEVIGFLMIILSIGIPLTILIINGTKGE